MAIYIYEYEYMKDANEKVRYEQVVWSQVADGEGVEFLIYKIRKLYVVKESSNALNI